jgi:hypothetical protein
MPDVSAVDPEAIDVLSIDADTKAMLDHLVIALLVLNANLKNAKLSFQHIYTPNYITSIINAINHSNFSTSTSQMSRSRWPAEPKCAK